MTEHSQDLMLKLAQSRQDLEHARARVAELEAALAIDFKPPAGPGPSIDPRLQTLVVYPREPAGHSLASFAKLTHDLPHHQQAAVQGLKLNRTLGLLRDLNQAIVRMRHLPSLFATACTLAVESGAFRMAWIGLFDAETRHMKAVAQAGVLAGDLEKLAPNFWAEPAVSPPQANQWQPGVRWVCNDLENEPQMTPWCADALRLGYRAAVALPLVIAGEVGGSFNLYAAEPDFFDEQQLELLDKMAMGLSFAMAFAAQEEQRHQAEAAVKRYAQRMEILHNIDRGIIGATSMQAVVEVALCHIRQLIPCQRASVILFDWATQEWIVFADDASQPSSIPKAVRHKIPPGWDEGFGTAQTRIIDDLRTIPPTPVYQQLIKDGLVAGIQARLVVQGQLLGLFGLNAVTPGFFTAEHQEIATEVANQLAIAIQQMHLSEAITRHTAELERHVVEIQRTDEVLRRSESLFRAIFEQAAVGIAHCALDGRCLQVNPRFAEIVGYSIEELLEKTFQSFTHPADLLADLKGIHQLEQGEIPFYATQKRYCHQRGHVVWVNLTVSLVRDAQGTPDYYIAVVEEITQLKQAEQALLQSEDRYRRVVEDQLDLIGRFQLDFKLTFVNRAYAEAFGKDPDALIGQSILDLIPPAYHAHVIAHLASMNPAKLSATTENPLQLADGTIHWFQWTNQLTLDEAGHPVEYQTVGRDITAQKTFLAEQQQQAQAVEEMRQFLESTLDAFPASTAVLDGDGTIIKINAAWQQFGEEHGASLSQSWLGENYLTVCDNVTGLNAAEAESTAAGIRAVIRGQKDDFYLEYPCHHATEQRWFGLRVMPFVEAPPRRVVTAHINITERVQIEQAEREQRRFAEALRDSLAALTTSRDVKRVLQQILDYAVKVVPCDAGSIILFEGDYGRVAYLWGFAPEAMATLIDYQFPLESLSYGEMFINKTPYFVSDTQTAPGWIAIPLTDWIRSSIGIPIESRDKLIGMIVVDSASPYHFQPTDVEKLQAFAGYASLALENAYHVTELEERVVKRTAELNEAKERVEALLNNSPDGILLVHPDLSIQQTNAAFYRLFACEPDDAYYGSLYDLIHAADLARVQASITTALQTQTGQQIEIRCYRKDGTLFEVNFRISQIPATITGAARLLCTLTDITERKQAQAGLAEERNLLRTLIDTIPDSIYIKDLHHHTVLSNLARANSFGMTPEETVGKDDFAFVPAAMAQQFQADEAQLFQSGLPLRNREERTIGPDGTVIWAVTTKFPLRNLQGELIGLVGITRDISERKARERQLRYYASLQENVSDAVIATDLEFRIQSWNQAAETIYGWRAEEAIGQKLTELLPSTDYRSDQESDQQAKQALLEHGKWQGEIVHRRRDGTELYMLSSVTLLKDEHGLPIGVVGVNRDITDRHNAEQAMQAKTEEERTFQNYLKALHEITLELMQIDQLDDFYKQTVVLGRSRLGFDRLALFLYDAEQNTALGTFGTDLAGEIHDERSLRFTPKPDNIMRRAFQSAERFCLDSAKTLYHNLAPIGFGWNAAAALWSGTQSVGWLVTDNLLQQQPVSKPLLEIFALYALTIGSLLGRKKTEAALRESEARYRLLADNITDMVIRFNAVIEFVYVSPSSRTLLGYEPEALLGQSGFAFLHADDLAALQEFHREILVRPTPFVSLTCRFRHRAGHYLWLEFAARLIRAEGTGELLELIVSARNVTNRKKAEDALRAKTEEEHTFQTYLKALHEITIELTLIDVLDDFYKRAVELGLERLGFERLGLLLYDAEHDLVLGTYGTDAQGQVVAEHHLRFAAASLTGILQRTLARTDHFAFDEHAQLFSNFKPIGVGWNAAAGLWNGQQSLGCLAADNGVLHKPVSKALLDILALYSSVIGSLLARKQSDAALRESEERFRLLLDAAPIATVISNQTGQIVLINNQTETLFGYHRKELVGQPVEMLVPDYARGRHAQNRTTYTAAPRVRQMGNGFELFARHKDGQEFPVEIELSYIQTATGLLIMSFILDITERKQSSAALEEQRIFLRQVIDVSPSMIFVKDYDGRFVLVNPIVAQMYNTSVEALLGKSDANFNPSAQEVANFLAADRRVIASGEPIFVEEPVTSLSGETHWLQTTKVPIVSADGKSKYVLGVSTDITARKKAEEALRQNEELLRTVLENLPVGVWIIDPDGTITQGNPAGQQIWGGAPTTGLEVYNERKRWWTNAEEQNAVDEWPAARAIAKAITQARTMGETSLNQALEIEAFDGTHKYILNSTVPIRDPWQKIQGVIVVNQDITELKQNEKMIRQALEKEKELGELKSRFVSMASHEFRTPLASILALTETLRIYRLRLPDEQIEQKLGKIKEQVGHLKDVMDDVLQLAQLQVRRTEFNPTQFNLDNLCHTILDEFQSQSDVTHQLFYTCNDALREVELDKKLMRQLINNLVSNAIKYSSSDKTIGVNLTYTDNAFVLTVHDEGIGIPSADLNHLFEPFHRAVNVGTISGTGLGLVIAKESVELHGGAITVESQVGVGTTFTVRIPIVTRGVKNHANNSGD